MTEEEKLRKQLLEEHKFTAPKSWKAPRLLKELNELSSKDKSDEDKSGEDKSDEDKSDEDKSGEDKSDEDKSDEDKSGEDEPLVEENLHDDRVTIEAKIGFTPTSRKISSKAKGEQFKVSAEDAEFFVKVDRTCKYVK